MIKMDHYSLYSDYLNYEIKAVGAGVMSTVPDGGYRKLTGTNSSTCCWSDGAILRTKTR